MRPRYTKQQLSRQSFLKTPSGFGAVITVGNIQALTQILYCANPLVDRLQINMRLAKAKNCVRTCTASFESKGASLELTSIELVK